jgi:hypothetical protein
MVLHYGLPWNVSGMNYSFSKYWYLNFDLLICPPWKLR